MTHTGWPPNDPRYPNAPKFGTTLPRPGVEVTDGVLRCWYGDRNEPALILDEFRLDAI